MDKRGHKKSKKQKAKSKTDYRKYPIGLIVPGFSFCTRLFVVSSSDPSKIALSFALFDKLPSASSFDVITLSSLVFKENFQWIHAKQIYMENIPYEILSTSNPSNLFLDSAKIILPSGTALSGRFVILPPEKEPVNPTIICSSNFPMKTHGAEDEFSDKGSPHRDRY